MIWTSCSRNSPRTGLTLLEVSASLLLLGTLLVGLLVANQKTVRQIQRSQHRFEALNAAEALVSGWLDDADTFPLDQQGVVPMHSDLTWRTTVQDGASDSSLEIIIVRLEILQNLEAKEADSVIPLATIDIALPPRSELRDE